MYYTFGIKINWEFYMLTFLAFLFAVVTLAKIVTFMFYPKKFAKMIDHFTKAIQGDFIIAQMSVLALVFVTALLTIPFIGILPLIATGWFWSAVFFLGYLPIYTCKEIAPFLKKLVLDKEGVQRMQLILGFFLILSLTVIVLCVKSFLGWLI